MNQFQRARGTFPDTSRRTTAKVTLLGLFLFIVNTNNPEVTVLGAQPAPCTFIRVNYNGPCLFIPFHGIPRANGLAIGIVTLPANHRFVNQTFINMKYFQ